MKFLIEDVQDNIKLTSHQKAILATIAQSTDKTVADDILSNDRNLSGALKQLVKMQMVINARDDRYAATDLGKKFAKEAGIIDDSGELTEVGQEMVIDGEQIANESVGTFKDYLMLI